jgi:hypothetical protein
VAWLDERDFSAKGECRGRPSGPLTALGLYEALRKPRVGDRKHGVSSSRVTTSENLSSIANSTRISAPSAAEFGDTFLERQAATTSTPLQDNNAAPAADRRLIYLTDLDSSSIYVLAATAPEDQMAALRDSLYKHLSLQASVGCSITQTGYSGCWLSFHLPFYAMRPSYEPKADLRLDLQDRPLRRVDDVSYLDWDRDRRIYLYEAQISFVVSGIDNWRWTAYCFVDEYFQDENHTDASNVVHPHDRAIAKAQMGSSSLKNATEPKITTDDPKEYFLSCFFTELKLIRKEWKSVLTQMRRSLRKYEQVGFPRTSCHHALINTRMSTLPLHMHPNLSRLSNRLSWKSSSGSPSSSHSPSSS